MFKKKNNPKTCVVLSLSQSVLGYNIYSAPCFINPSAKKLGHSHRAPTIHLSFVLMELFFSSLILAHKCTEECFFMVVQRTVLGEETVWTSYSSTIWDAINLSAVLDIKIAHCPTMKGLLFMIAIRHPLSLDGRPHRATLAAKTLPSRACVCLYQATYTKGKKKERKKIHVAHMCTTRLRQKGSKCETPPTLPSSRVKGESVADSVTRHGYRFN